ncbi:diiron oxygenase [Aquirhabdus parva]|uniref:Uncharacterized protein n=1 Tax=Aquirhabdus parva TaxID=2283318 RepID=A0A345P937_9GAMM|nr:diiron oxygenase [Aquirhabdus parva]AXI03796.1 hypothetical protein HYN46_13715 [Aquirhabdus parva]
MILKDLNQINKEAHIHTFHPSGLDWPERFDDEELKFLSRVAFNEEGHERAAIAYLTKELAQLAEIERHVSAVMTIVLADLQGEEDRLSEGFELHHALTCFAAEELQHANLFYRYVRLLSQDDFKYANNLFQARLTPYQGTDSPYIKLAALCCSAYIGESVITVFERKTRALDPEMKYFFTRLLYWHGLDEARHVQTDHFVFEHIVPNLTAAEQRRMRQILDITEALNGELATRFEAYTKEKFGFDYTENNYAHHTQLELTGKFRSLVFGERISKVDDAMDDEGRALLQRFSQAETIHV